MAKYAGALRSIPRDNSLIDIDLCVFSCLYPNPPAITNAFQVRILPSIDLPRAWINEIHYVDDQPGSIGEFVEIAGFEGTELAYQYNPGGPWEIYVYGADGFVQYSVSLSGVIPDQSNRFGALAFDLSSAGLPDAQGGLALFDPAESLVEFLSYGGVITAQDGPASIIGQDSVDIGVTESATKAPGCSLQRTGLGVLGSNFAFVPPQPESPGTVNAGQTFPISRP